MTRPSKSSPDPVLSRSMTSGIATDSDDMVRFRPEEKWAPSYRIRDVRVECSGGINHEQDFPRALPRRDQKRGAMWSRPGSRLHDRTHRYRWLVDACYNQSFQGSSRCPLTMKYGLSNSGLLYTNGLPWKFVTVPPASVTTQWGCRGIPFIGGTKSRIQVSRPFGDHTELQ